MILTKNRYTFLFCDVLTQSLKLVYVKISLQEIEIFSLNFHFCFANQLSKFLCLVS